MSQSLSSTEDIYIVNEIRIYSIKSELFFIFGFLFQSKFIHKFSTKYNCYTCFDFEKY